MLVERLERDDVPVWLVNTGWTGGPYGAGERMNIAHTRAMVRAALDGALDGGPDADRSELRRSRSRPAVRTCPASFLDPRATWADPDAYDRAAAELVAMFRANFAGYADGVDAAIAAAGPRPAELTRQTAPNDASLDGQADVGAAMPA